MRLTTSIARNCAIDASRTTFVIVLAAVVLCCVGAAAEAMAPAVATCGVDHSQTAPIQSSTHFTAVLKMHSEDDHAKDSHLCWSEYTLQITRPDGSSMMPFEFGYADDIWDRPLVFRIDGFSQDGNRAFVSISEGAYPQSFEALEYNMKSGKTVNDILLDRRFTKSLSRECAATLRIVGTSPEGHIVLGPDTRSRCSHGALWDLSSKKTTSPTPGPVLPESAKLLRSVAGVKKLDPGTAAQP